LLNRVVDLLKNSGITLFILRLPFRAFRYLLNKVNTLYYRCFLGACGKGSVIQYGVHIEQPQKVFIGDNVFIASGTIINSENNTGILKLNSNVHIGKNCHIDHSGDLTLCEFVLTSENVRIYSHSHGFDPRSSPVPKSKIIGRNVWLGTNVIILESVAYIADYVVIAAGSVVTKDIELSSTVWAGTPSKMVKHYAG
jgi:acetyltransferase-like isoleucine patch superfamily enzyme